MKINILDIVIVLILIVAIISALIVIRRNKGKCAYCNLADNCPFRKVNKNVK